MRLNTQKVKKKNFSLFVRGNSICHESFTALIIFLSQGIKFPCLKVRLSSWFSRPKRMQIRRRSLAKNGNIGGHLTKRRRGQRGGGGGRPPKRSLFLSQTKSDLIINVFFTPDTQIPGVCFPSLRWHNKKFSEAGVSKRRNLRKFLRKEF